MMTKKNEYKMGSSSSGLELIIIGWKDTAISVITPNKKPRLKLSPFEDFSCRDESILHVCTHGKIKTIAILYQNYYERIKEYAILLQ
jgi:hypothetical protein